MKSSKLSTAASENVAGRKRASRPCVVRGTHNFACVFAARRLFWGDLRPDPSQYIRPNSETVKGEQIAVPRPALQYSQRSHTKMFGEWMNYL